MATPPSRSTQPAPDTPDTPDTPDAPDTPSADDAPADPIRRSILIEYCIIFAAALLLLTVPSLGSRFIYGPVDDPGWEVGGAVFMLGNMAAFALLLGYVVHARGIGWGRLGLHRSARAWGRGLLEGLVLGAALTVLMLIWFAAEAREVWHAEHSEFDFMAIPAALAIGIWLLALLANSVGEELLRAYVIGRGEDLGWPTPFAAFLSVLLFFSYHTYYTAESLLPVTVVGGVLLTLYYLVSRNLLALIVAHTTINYTWLFLAA